MGLFFNGLIPINELEIKDSKGNVVNNDKEEEKKKPTPPPEEETTEEEDEDIGADMPEGDDESDDSSVDNTSDTESNEDEQDTEEDIGSDMPTDDDSDDGDYNLPDDSGDTTDDNDEDIGEDMPEGDDTGEEEGDEDIGEDMPEGDDEEGGGDSESGAGGDTGNDDSGGNDNSDSDAGENTGGTGKPSQKEEIEAIEKELFSDLSDDQMAIKHKELKGQFIDMYESIGDIIDRVNVIPKTDKNIKTLEFIGAKLGELREIINYNLTEGYDTRGYVENVVIYQQCLVTLNTIDQLLKEIIPETDE